MGVARQGFEGGSIDRVGRLWTFDRFRDLESHYEAYGMASFTALAIQMGQELKDSKPPQADAPTLEQFVQEASYMSPNVNKEMEPWLAQILG